MNKIITVIPALNEAQTLREVLIKTGKYVDRIVVVDDGSTDTTKAIAEDANTTIISHDKREGYDKSLNDGFRKAADFKPEIIITLDADGQYEPSEIPLIVKSIMDDKADIVIGKRPKFPRISEQLFGLIGKITIGVDDVASGFKAYRTQVYESVGYFDKISSIGTELTFNAWKRGFRICQREISIKSREGSSRLGGRLKANWEILGGICRVLIKLMVGICEK